jgi:hypothetical protein
VKEFDQPILPELKKKPHAKKGGKKHKKHKKKNSKLSVA